MNCLAFIYTNVFILMIFPGHWSVVPFTNTFQLDWKDMFICSKSYVYIYKICCCYWAAEHRQSHVENWKHFKWLRWTIRQKHVENHLMLVSFQFTNITMSLTSPRWTCQSIKVILRTETRGGYTLKPPIK